MLPAFKTILYATDLAPHGPKIFRYALALARQHQARIVLLHALEPLSHSAITLVHTMVPSEMLAKAQAEGLAAVRDEIHKRLQRFCDDELGAGTREADVVSEVRIVEGAAAPVIPDVAREVGADVIVMGMHGHSRLEYMFLGSVANRVVSHSHIPVLLVPADAEPA